MKINLFIIALLFASCNEKKIVFKDVNYQPIDTTIFFREPYEPFQIAVNVEDTNWNKMLLYSSEIAKSSPNCPKIVFFHYKYKKKAFVGYAVTSESKKRTIAMFSNCENKNKPEFKIIQSKVLDSLRNGIDLPEIK